MPRKPKPDPWQDFCLPSKRSPMIQKSGAAAGNLTLISKKPNLTLSHGPNKFDLMRLPSELRIEVYKKLLPRQWPGLWVRPRPKTSSADVSPFVHCRPPKAKDRATLVRLNGYGRKDWHAIRVLNNNWNPLQHEVALIAPLLNLAKASRTTRAEIIALLHNLSCYGIPRPIFLPSAVPNHSVITPFNLHTYLSQRFFTQVFAHHPKIDYLQLSGVHTHKVPTYWGTRYEVADLRLMKFILDNTHLERVVVIRQYSRFCEGYDIDQCSGEIAIVTEAGFEWHFAKGRHWYGGEILVDVELSKWESARRARAVKEWRGDKHNEDYDSSGTSKPDFHNGWRFRHKRYRNHQNDLAMRHFWGPLP
ncbi:uncharacterized protein AB675_905 [Cyphellophora attinorum]|uniref:Uncharacterized protein n=1 Tax=Cyphellophora attinorum TaxID=1664694 RepID=A0A0N1P2Y6_9EURO|nr:uncharacterized protein AB675_905 [Phialophora attinorum]KPI46107.1 hypothetical protein AB675_905 [Phialophora attinorum]